MNKCGHSRATCCPSAILVLTASICGCGFDWGYVLTAAVGEFDLLRNSVPLSQAAEDTGTAADVRAKLELIRDARMYAREIIGLNVADNYTLFYDSSGEPVAYNISACRKDTFQPRLWTFPVVGTVPYLGFFDRQAADAKFDELAAEQFDVFMYEMDAYSGLGFFPIVVLSPMLDRSEISLVETVFHELLHSTIWRPDDTTFTESLATFVGRTAATAYLADRYPLQPDLVHDAVRQFQDADRFSDFVLTLFAELDRYYSTDLPSQVKIEGREAIYQAGRDRFAAEVQPLMNQPNRYDWVRQLPTNNAWLLGVRRYHLDLDVFEEVFAATGGDWPASLQRFREAAAESAPYAYLRTWLTTRHVEVSPFP